HVIIQCFIHAGWKLTYDRYYQDKTRSILRHMLDHLSKDPDLKFCWTEVTYLKQWYSALSADDQASFLKILRNGQLEILSGGWVMPDEAVTHYTAILDQLTEGHLWLQKELSQYYTVRHGMAVDPFGHSPTAAYLLRRSGVSDVIIQRAHFALKKHLALKQQLEFNW
ncbi:hypothetical protein CAPTEDRAFT_65804, partial [Capitella teleta]|uniref:Glycoside hydrolase family 38 N-terminal domain-containing protein n=1 Tax=Capitella teleta TaxID=283909 RepID=X2B7F2_CAPTE